MVPPERGLRSGFASLQIDGTEWRVFGTHGAERDVQVYVGERAGARSAILLAVLGRTLWPLALALPALALLDWWAVRRGLRPLRHLGRTPAGRAPQAWQPVLLDDVPAEMAPMLAALNDLFVRIGAPMESEPASPPTPRTSCARRSRRSAPRRRWRSAGWR
jgi:two-component system sensor histidine kinase QseC